MIYQTHIHILTHKLYLIRWSPKFSSLKKHGQSRVRKSFFGESSCQRWQTKEFLQSRSSINHERRLLIRHGCYMSKSRCKNRNRAEVIENEELWWLESNFDLRVDVLVKLLWNKFGGKNSFWVKVCLRSMKGDKSCCLEPLCHNSPTCISAVEENEAQKKNLWSTKCF